MPKDRLTAKIRADQVGYAPRVPGAVRVLADAELAEAAFSLTRDGAAVPFGLTVRRDPDSGGWAHAIAWGPLEPGALVLAVQGGPSATIRIADDVHGELLRAVLRTFYLQRCGIDIVEDPGGHPACHLADASRAHADVAGPAGERIAATGGWHDAGDFGKYAATTTTVLLELLTRYERYPSVAGALSLGIPESGGPLPDLLAECAVGLDWLLKMQRSDGAVYRKLGGRAWPAVAPPQEDTQERFVYGPSSPETGKAVAAWALASRVYRAFDAARADAYLRAAEVAWIWLQTAPDQVFDVQPGDNDGSGPYMLDENDPEAALGSDRDDRLAAAIELFLTTGDTHAAALVDKLLPTYAFELFEWKDVVSGSATSLLTHPKGEERWRRIVRHKLMARAKEARWRAERHPYGSANAHLVWASNKLAVEEGVLLAAADRIDPDPRWRAAAHAQRAFVLGCNPLGKCFVTGFGDDPVKDPSHLFLRSTGRPFPGLVVGGPNPKEQAGIAPKDRGLLSYADDGRSYSSNEPAIDYDAALAALLIDLRCADLAPYA